MAKKRRKKSFDWARALSLAHQTLRSGKGFEDGTRARLDAVKACESGGNLELADRFLQGRDPIRWVLALDSLHKARGIPQTQQAKHFKHAIVQCVKDQREIRAVGLLYDMHSLSLCASQQAYSEALRACMQNRVCAVENLLDMQDNHSLPVSYSTCSDAAHPSHQTGGMMCKMIQQMACEGRAVNTGVIAPLLSYCSHEDVWTQALSLLQLATWEGAAARYQVRKLTELSKRFFPLGAWRQTLLAWSSLQSYTAEDDNLFGIQDPIYFFWRTWWIKNKEQTINKQINSFNDAMGSTTALNDFHRKLTHLLDLHGMPSTVAEIAVRAFLAEGRFNRDLWIITGRGLNSRGGHAILKPLVLGLLRPYNPVVPRENPGMVMIPSEELLVESDKNNNNNNKNNTNKNKKTKNKNKKNNNAEQLPVADSEKHTRIWWMILWVGWLRGHGVGASIEGINDGLWGRVVEKDYGVWVLDSGRIAKKRTCGRKWKWVRGLPPGIDARWPGWLRGRGVGASVESIDGKRWGLAVEDVDDVWVLDTGRTVKKDAMGTNWRWVRGRPPFINARWSGWLRGRGVGASIESINGKRWGLAVEEVDDSWVLDNGQTVQNKKIGKKVKWVRGLPPFANV